MNLKEIYNIARSNHFEDFESIIKSRLTGLPTTQEIDCEIEIQIKRN